MFHLDPWNMILCNIYPMSYTFQHIVWGISFCTSEVVRRSVTMFSTLSPTCIYNSIDFKSCNVSLPEQNLFIQFGIVVNFWKVLLWSVERYLAERQTIFFMALLVDFCKRKSFFIYCKNTTANITILSSITLSLSSYSQVEHLGKILARSCQDLDKYVLPRSCFRQILAGSSQDLPRWPTWVITTITNIAIINHDCCHQPLGNTTRPFRGREVPLVPLPLFCAKIL